MLRGQPAWGAMEVLLTVIVLGFSMAIVFYAVQNVEETRCVATLKAQTTALQNAMLDVSLGSPPTQRKVDYSFPSCRGRQVSALRFAYFKKPSFCNICPGVYNGCWIIIPTYKDKSGGLYEIPDASVCVNMPADIELNILSGGQCLGGSARTTETPCLPGATCTPLQSNVPTNVFTPGPGLGCASPLQNSCWRTFAPISSDGKLLRFILSKSSESSRLSGVINICAVKPVA